MISRPAKESLRQIFLLVAFFVFVLNLSGVYDKKLEITNEKTDVYLKPDTGSSVIGLLKRGDIVTLASPTKIKSHWYYIYFNLDNSDFTSSGYIPDAAVKKLFSVTKKIVIDKGSTETNKYGYGSRFKNIHWGMNQEQVMLNEGPPLNRENKGEYITLTYYAELMDKRCLLTYFFSQDSLVSAVYHVSEKYLEKSLTRKDHVLTKSALIQKYGEPKEERAFRQYIMDRTHPVNDSGFPSSPLLLQRTCWENTETRICLYLYQNKELIEMKMEYATLSLFLPSP